MVVLWCCLSWCLYEAGNSQETLYLRMALITEVESVVGSNWIYNCTLINTRARGNKAHVYPIFRSSCGF